MKRPPSGEWVDARSYSSGRPGCTLTRGWAAAVGRIGWRKFLCWYKLADPFLHLPGCPTPSRLSHPFRLADEQPRAFSARALARCIRGLRCRGPGSPAQASPPAQPNGNPSVAKPNEPGRWANPKEPERGGPAGGLAFVATCANEPERAAISERTQLVAAFPDRTPVRVPNEPERRRVHERTQALRRSERTRARPYPNLGPPVEPHELSPSGAQSEPTRVRGIGVNSGSAQLHERTRASSKAQRPERG
jgi:hypothetical protein